MSYERLRSETLFEGGFFDVVRERVRYEDGSEHQREFARHPGAVAILPHDSERIFMVRQPRESVGEGDLLELPAGKLDARGGVPAGLRPPGAARGGRDARRPLGAS